MSKVEEIVEKNLTEAIAPYSYTNYAIDEIVDEMHIASDINITRGLGSDITKNQAKDILNHYSKQMMMHIAADVENILKINFSIRIR